MSTKRTYHLRFAIESGKALGSIAHTFPTLWVMKVSKLILPRRYRKVMIDVYHRNR